MATFEPTQLPCWVKALYSWSGEEKKDLGFVEGDVIEVLNTGDGNWWMGRLKRNKMVGYFPCNFVQLIESNPSSRQTTPVPESIPTSLAKQAPVSAAPLDSMAKTARSSPRKSLYEAPPKTYESTDDFLKDISQELNKTLRLDDFSSSGSSLDSSTASAAHGNSSASFASSRGLSISQSLSSSRGYSHNSPLRESQDSWEQPQYHEGDFAPQKTPMHRSDSWQPSPYASPAPFEAGQDDFDANDDEFDADMPNTPPIPPQHSVPLTRSENSPPASPSAADRTPSPLRNAMDSVLESLDNLQDISRSSSTAFHMGGRSSGIYEPQDSTYDMSYGNGISPARSQVQRGYSQLQPSPSRGSMQSQMKHSHSYSTTATPVYTASMNQSKSANGWLSSLAKPQVNGSPESDDDLPFDASSYDNPRPSLSRMDTQSTVADLSILSYNSPTGSRLNYRNSMSIASPSVTRSGTLDLPDDRIEKPVTLPGTEPEVKASRSLKLRKSTGFIRKLFNSGGEKEESDTAIAGSTLTRTKSRSSRRSIRTSASASRLRESIFSVSSKAVKAMGGAGQNYSSREYTPAAENLWIEVNRDIHRAKSLTQTEVDKRRTQLELSGVPARWPFKSLARVLGGQTLNGAPTRGDGRQDPRRQDFTHVDKAMSGVRSISQLMTPAVWATSHIERQFDYDIERLRAVFLFCAFKFTWERDVEMEGDDDDEEQDTYGQAQTRVSLTSMMKNRRATSRELAHCVKSMCESVGIRCEVVRGHLKGPGEIYDTTTLPKPNHFWNAVVVDDEWWLMDVSLANPSFDRREAYCGEEMESSQFGVDTASAPNVTDSFFLMRPMEFIYTHVPCDARDQHLVPTLPAEDALALPLATPASFKFDCKFVNFHSGLTRLINLDVAEINLQVPLKVDLTAEVSVSRNDVDGSAVVPGLAQPYWQDGRRYFRVKGLLPENYSKGVLSIYAGERPGAAKGSNLSKFKPVLIYSLPITHDQSENSPFEFVARHCTPHCHRQDLYVEQPQCKRLVEGHQYTFMVRQHPATGITSGSGFSRLKIAVQSPSGRITKLQSTIPDAVYGTWQTSVKCHEVGTWRGLVFADSRAAWSVFAEWYCV